MAEQHSWHDDTPATDEQIETIRRDLDGGSGVGGAAFSRHAVRKLLAAYDEVRLDRTVLTATNTALEARAEKAEFELAGAREANAMLRDGGKKLRAELDKCAALNRELVNENAQCQAQLAETSADGAQWQQRAKKAERDIERWNRAATLLESGCIVGKRNVFEIVAALTERAETAERELAKVRERVADDIEAYAEAIGWYEGGGVWAEAIGVARIGRKAGERKAAGDEQ